MFEYVLMGFAGWLFFLVASFGIFCVAGIFVGLINGEGFGYMSRVFRGDYHDPAEPYDHFEHGW